MYQSLRVACCGSLACRQCRLSISAWPIASASSPVRTFDRALLFAEVSGARSDRAASFRYFLGPVASHAGTTRRAEKAQYKQGLRNGTAASRVSVARRSQHRAVPRRIAGPLPRRRSARRGPPGNAEAARNAGAASRRRLRYAVPIDPVSTLHVARRTLLHVDGEHCLQRDVGGRRDAVPGDLARR